MTPAAATVLAETVQHLPDQEAGPLLLAPEATAVPFTSVDDPAWLDRQLELRGQRWGTDDRRVLATLWWYSVSNWFQVPAIASLVATGRVLSPLPEDVAVHWLPDSRVTGGTASRVLEGTDPVVTFATALRATLERVVPRIAAAGGMKERPLWAIAADSTANRFLWAGRATADEARATALAQQVADAVGPPLPRTRWADVVAVDDDGRDRPDLGTHRFLRRASCCLLYEAPGQSRCGSCPGRRPEDRLLGMQVAATARTREP